MTLDEAINILKSDNDYNKSIGCNTSYEEQLAEWLENYKRLKELFSKTFIKDCNTCEQEIYQKAYKEGQDKGFSDGHFFGYNKGIDDFVKFANTMPTVEEEDGTIRPMWLEEMAEQLKEQK